MRIPLYAFEGMAGMRMEDTIAKMLTAQMALRLDEAGMTAGSSVPLSPEAVEQMAGIDGSGLGAMRKKKGWFPKGFVSRFRRLHKKAARLQRTKRPQMTKADVMEAARPGIRAAARSVARGVKRQIGQVERTHGRVWKLRRRLGASRAESSAREHPRWRPEEVLLPHDDTFDVFGAYDVERGADAFGEWGFDVEEGADAFGDFDVATGADAFGQFDVATGADAFSVAGYDVERGADAFAGDLDDGADAFPMTGLGLTAGEAVRGDYIGAVPRSNAADSFIAAEESAWDFKEDVVAEHPPTPQNVARVAKYGAAAAMDEIDRTGSITRMKRRLKLMAINEPRQWGKPRNAGEAAYKRIVTGLRRAGVVRTRRGRPVQVRMRPRQIRAAVTAGSLVARKKAMYRAARAGWRGR